ncbi:tRNA (N6-isopentenyl adenosine(37)-C2)-methylthiotransferase MiaB [Dyadobacter chenhuakuii]|uniref:tRNA-2-methylthio-N(6)-dimethylallyladenosine synthase n=1 Tax=Dyadobacter chenhuakuii TaxID=2909339 RepID=A0A9X1QG38_9BACT|nr:tRNA (N6-isopentenyl adenosine(37)-C2)-methylthiotransferase MiaB [Dyadobacter chenhuakuii]MCF2493739.1 tRNA (N6-isopentenyl adenosine(37)-C2)-methylthiotransferase MiaB [Dyadobacter chenhuakuii]MCF2500750.1 tRNA (N6-isopentenyl adenosine(37)-C2)-methylthiotransferase MiaB [Dyadobacter chenhuakuii]USJ30873.1 tRNA (N6-isopentenyl adenosine(37)-C2)-methylthiotransferase MiaB [Dyadobacter chenhuakuii]
MENRIAETLKILTEEDKVACETVRISENEPAFNKKLLFIESYGCQMNFADSEIVASVMREAGFATTSDVDNADLIFLNTCAIRDNAEQRVRTRLRQLNVIKKKKPGTLIGVLGCMAERLKAKLLEEEKMVDIVTGPDAYRDLPRLVEEAETGQKGVNVFLSREETYADISPIRLNSNGVTALVSIMRGCDNMCSFCVVPMTRGRERSRDPFSIVKEAQDLFDDGYKEVTLLGQNVDSYKWQAPNSVTAISTNVDNGTLETQVNFAQLLEMVAQISPELRVRFSTSHPKDITDEVLHTIKKYDNICKYIHLPAQHGNSRVLEMMNRTYNREWYLERIDSIRRILGDECAISHDMIAGFCSETEEEHQDSLSLLEYVRFDFGYMFAYSERPGTLAAKKYADDIPADIKQRRLAEIIDIQQRISLERNQKLIGTVQKVLVENTSKRSVNDFTGRSDQNKRVIFPRENFKVGDYVDVLITDTTAATLRGYAVEKVPVS